MSEWLTDKAVVLFVAAVVLCALLWRKRRMVSASENSVAAGRDITGSITINQRHPKDEELIDSLMSHNQSLMSHSQTLADENNQLRGQLVSAVTQLSTLDESEQAIRKANEALAKGDTDEAKALFRRAAQRTDDEVTDRSRQVAEYYRSLGALAYLDDTAESLSAYQRATELDPNNPDAWNLLGHLLLFPALFQQPFLFPIRLRRGLFSRFGTDAQDKVGRWLTGLAITRS